MFKLYEDDKELLGAILGLWFIIVALLAIINAAPRHAQTTPKKYDLICTVSYVKIPFKECISMELR